MVVLLKSLRLPTSTTMPPPPLSSSMLMLLLTTCFDAPIFIFPYLYQWSLFSIFIDIFLSLAMVSSLMSPPSPHFFFCYAAADAVVVGNCIISRCAEKSFGVMYLIQVKTNNRKSAFFKSNFQYDPIHILEYQQYSVFDNKKYSEWCLFFCVFHFFLFFLTSFSLSFLENSISSWSASAYRKFAFDIGFNTWFTSIK